MGAALAPAPVPIPAPQNLEVRSALLKGQERLVTLLPLPAGQAMIPVHLQSQYTHMSLLRA